MYVPTFFSELLLYATSLCGWQDACEILFFSFIVYYFSLWLSRDESKNLLLSFYGYLGLLATSHTLHLYSMHFFLVCAAPLALILYILMHQETLQKNFITLRTTPTKAPQEDWIENLIQVCLQTINNNKEIHIIIEQNCTLKDFLYVPFDIDTKINTKLLMLMIETNTYDQNKFLWISQGKFLGMNAYLHDTIEYSSHIDAKNLEQWKQDALLITHKTDAFIVSITPKTRTFTLIHTSKIFENISGTLLVNILKKQLQTKTSVTKGSSYESMQKNSIQQTLS